MRPSGAKNTQENPRRSPRGAQEEPRGAQEEPRGAQERPRGTQETPKRSQKAVLAAIFGVIKRQKSAKMDLRATLPLEGPYLPLRRPLFVIHKLPRALHCDRMWARSEAQGPDSWPTS